MFIKLIQIAASMHFMLVKLASAENAILYVKSWQSLNEFPAFTDFPESSVKEVLLKPNTAIGFSGGGSRAYVCALGYLAGLSELDLIKNIRYIGNSSQFFFIFRYNIFFYYGYCYNEYILLVFL